MNDLANPAELARTPSLDPYSLYERMIERRRELPPSPLDQQRAQALQEYQNVVQTAQPPGDPMDAMLTGFTETGKNPFDPFHGLRMGLQGFQQAKEAQRQELYKRAVQAARLGYQDVAERAKLESTEERSLFPRGSVGGMVGKIQVVKTDTGDVMFYNNVTGESKVVPASKMPLWKAAYDKALKEAFDNRDLNAHETAVEFANSAVGASPQGIASAATRQEPSVNVHGSPGQSNLPDATKGQLSFDLDRWPPEAQDEGLRLIRRLQQSYHGNNPGHAELQASTERKLLDMQQRFGGAPIPGEASAKPAAPRMTFLEPRGEKRQEGYGTEEGKALAKERESLTSLYGSAASHIGDLDTLKALYQKFDVPGGAFADQWQAAASGLVSLGIDVGPNVDASAVAKALSSKMALEIRTQGQQNLLPGAMSNYEDKLLQGMAPTLSQTPQGRMLLIELMRQIAASNQRIADEATRFAKDNEDQLTPAWYGRKERVQREEMARLAITRRKLLEQMQQGGLK